MQNDAGENVDLYIPRKWWEHHSWFLVRIVQTEFENLMSFLY